MKTRRWASSPPRGPDGGDHAARGFETLQVLADAVKGAQNLDLGYGVESAALVGEEVHARERLEAATEARLRAPDALAIVETRPES